jgi:hypothetical protein
MKRHTAAHRASTQLSPLLQVVYGVCLKEWGKFTEMKNQRRWEKRSKKGRSVKYLS